jgi:hypothetical protein
MDPPTGTIVFEKRRPKHGYLAVLSVTSNNYGFSVRLLYIRLTEKVSTISIQISGSDPAG